MGILTWAQLVALRIMMDGRDPSWVDVCRFWVTEFNWGSEDDDY